MAAWEQIIEAAKRSGITYNVTSTVRDTNDHHGSGQAVDFGGYSQDALAEYFFSKPQYFLEIIHKSDATGKFYGVKNGRVVGESFYGSEVALHRNHLHTAATESQIRAFMASGGGAVTTVGASNSTLLTFLIRSMK